MKFCIGFLKDVRSCYVTYSLNHVKIELNEKPIKSVSLPNTATHDTLLTLFFAFFFVVRWHCSINKFEKSTYQ